MAEIELSAVHEELVAPSFVLHPNIYKTAMGMKAEHGEARMTPDKRTHVVFMSGTGEHVRVWAPYTHLDPKRFTVHVIGVENGLGGKSLAQFYEERLARIFAEADRVVLVGHSFGAFMAFRIADPMHRHKILRILAICGTPEYKYGPHERAMYLLPHPLSKSIYNLFIRDLFPSMLRRYYFYPSTPDEVVQRFVAQNGLPEYEEIFLDRQIRKGNYFSNLEILMPRTTLLMAERDCIFSPGYVRSLKKRYPSLDLRIIERSGHMAPVERIDELRNEVWRAINAQD